MKIRTYIITIYGRWDLAISVEGLCTVNRMLHNMQTLANLNSLELYRIQIIELFGLVKACCMVVPSLHLKKVPFIIASEASYSIVVEWISHARILRTVSHPWKY